MTCSSLPASRVAHLAQNTTSIPCSLLSRHTPLSAAKAFADIHVHKTSPPSTQIWAQNTLFPVLNFKVGKMNYCLGSLDPNWAIYLQNGQKNSKIYSCNFLLDFKWANRLEWGQTTCDSGRCNDSYAAAVQLSNKLCDFAEALVLPIGVTARVSQ